MNTANMETVKKLSKAGTPPRRNPGFFFCEDYSREELVAEIGSASLMATLGLESTSTLTASAAYIKNWLKALKNDKKMIVIAASRAEKAVKMILNIKDTCDILAQR